MDEASEHLTQLLNRAAEGDGTAAREVMPEIYRQLKRLAVSARGRLPAGETLQVTALVHEAYIRVVDKEPEGWKARSHFFFAAARAMRDILVEEARRKAAAKHGGGLDRVDADAIELAVETPSEDLFALEKALARLEQESAEGFEIVMLRYFTGLTVPEVADIMGVSLSTVERKWRFARAWLGKELGPRS